MVATFITHKYRDPKSKSYRSKHYIKGELLGKGGFASCYSIKSVETKRHYACKIISKDKLKKKSTRSKLVSEIRIHNSVSDHKNIVKFIKWFEDEASVYIVLEICRNKSLLSLLNARGKLTESEVRYFMAQLLSALRHLRSRNVIHRDLKLANVFIGSDYSLKLGDFGLAAKLGSKDERKMTLCGTPNYIAPEMLQKKRQGHSFEVDVWSLGVIMYTLLVGSPPFETANVKLTYSRIRSKKYEFPKGLRISKMSKDLVGKILQIEPEKRPSLKEIRLDPFFTSALIPKSLPPNTTETPPVIKEYKETVSSSVYDPEIDGGMNEKTQLEETKTNYGFAENGGKSANRAEKSLTNTRENYRKERGTKTRELAEKQENKRLMAKADFEELKHQFSPSKDTGNCEKNSLNSSVLTECEINGQLPFFSPCVWMKSWVDYSSKYGVAFSLSNGNYGVYFNDATKMILDQHKTTIDYIYQENESDKAPALRKKIDVDDYPEELYKKVALMKYFAEYLDRKKDTAILDFDDIKEASEGAESKSKQVYLEHWYKSSKAKIFVLSNNTFQTNFNDNTELIISPLCQVSKNRRCNGCENFGSCSDFQKTVDFYELHCAATYTGKNGSRESFTFAAALSSDNASLKKRSNYCRDVLKKILPDL